ncbi:MAG: flagellar motor protein MotB [Bdellovibrionales bacterium]|nr:flagellar motor protein MotB [Bdellovibrionales bacterium]
MSTAEKFEDHEDDEDSSITLLDFDDGPSGGHDDGESIWLLSYSDMMTLLMGFFALLTSMASFDTEKFEKVGSGTAEFFGGTTDQTFSKLGEEIEKVVEKKGLSNQVKIETRNTQITVTFEGTLFFSSGSIELRQNAQGLMKEIISILEEKAGEKRFIVEGHTDDTPIHNGYLASNWELSSLRASRVARLFEEYGFKRDQILTIGWGETRPLYPNKNDQGAPIAENKAKNRRVILKIMNKLPL